ncbi:MAG TPA: class F sortase, partial [Streptomyces sp.]|nr:class F sortase [Streptomyces sp.]
MAARWARGTPDGPGEDDDVDPTRLRGRAWTAGIAALCGLWFVQNGAPEARAPPPPPPP